MSEKNTNLTTALPGSAAPVIETATMAQLLEATPLNTPRSIKGFFSQPQFGNISFPDEIRLHCEHEDCDGVRRHVKQDDNKFAVGEIFYGSVSYRCTNCTKARKVFVVRGERRTQHDSLGICTKIYQEPPFGYPIPKRLFQIIGEANRDHFLQARRAIARGLGIGAYAYYRRIVENTKFELVGAVLKVAEGTKASADQVQLLQRAQNERQFSKAIQLLSDVSAIPPVLLIDGHNPLSLLHDLLSDGIHTMDDVECLTRAQQAETVLCELAERMQMALTERKAVKEAVTSILNRRAKSEGGPCPR